MPAKKPATTPIPVQLSETEFTEFILPHLSMPSRGPKCKLGYHCVFNLILWVLYTRPSKNAVFGLNSRTDPWTQTFFPEVPVLAVYDGGMEIISLLE
jgi:hypothetical protein